MPPPTFVHSIDSNYLSTTSADTGSVSYDSNSRRLSQKRSFTTRIKRDLRRAVMVDCNELLQSALDSYFATTPHLGMGNENENENARDHYQILVKIAREACSLGRFTIAKTLLWRCGTSRPFGIVDQRSKQCFKFVDALMLVERRDLLRLLVLVHRNMLPIPLEDALHSVALSTPFLLNQVRILSFFRLFAIPTSSLVQNHAKRMQEIRVLYARLQHRIKQRHNDVDGANQAKLSW